MQFSAGRRTELIFSQILSELRWAHSKMAQKMLAGIFASDWQARESERFAIALMFSRLWPLARSIRA